MTRGTYTGRRQDTVANAGRHPRGTTVAMGRDGERKSLEGGPPAPGVAPNTDAMLRAIRQLDVARELLWAGLLGGAR